MSPAEIVQSVRDFFSLLFADFSSLWWWPLVFLGIMVVLVIYMLFAIKFSYEKRILKSINKINNYFVYKPFISEDNLVEFNQKMKKVPAVLRGAWQRYMLNREDGVKEYINISSCIDKPLRTSSIEKNLKGFTIFTILATILAFFTGLQFCATDATYNVVTTPSVVLFISLIVPVLMLVIYSIFILVFNASKDDLYAVMYETFPIFQYNLEKAVTKMPSYVDYEILFTSREIKDGIPILQQYLEKRALVEQEQLEKARRDSVASEEYDFSDLGVDGSFVLEKAMKECEAFIRVKRMLQEESNSIESEKENYRKTFENTSKEMQRKLQASRENMDSLKKQQEESTNRIETNYIRKQLADEIKKQQQLEKELEETTAKYNDEQVSLQKEIENRQAEIDEKKSFVEQALMLTFKHYANTLYKALLDKATNVSNEKLVTLTQENNDLRALLNDLEGGIDENYYDDNANLVQPQEVSINSPYPMSDEEKKALNIIDQQPQQQSETDAQISSQDVATEPESYQQPSYSQENLEQSSYQEQYSQDSFQQDYQAEQYQQPYDQPYQDQAYQEGQTAYQDSYYPQEGYSEQPYQEESYEQPYQQDSYPQQSYQEEAYEEPVQDGYQQPEFQPEVAPSAQEPIEEMPATMEPTKEQNPSEEDNPASNDASESGEDAPAEELAPAGEIYDDDTTDKELEEIQKQIEEENDKLKKEKEELTSELNSTINKIKKKEQTRKRSVRNKSKSTASKVSSTSKASTAKKKTTKTSTTSRKPKTKKEDKMSELDALNQEMEKLLNKTKKS